MRGRMMVALAAAWLSAVPAGSQRRATPGRERPVVRFDPVELSITDLQAAMRAGSLTSASLTDAYLARIAAYDHAGPALNSLIRLNPQARSDAAALDAERRAGRLRGPLHGIPVVLKDNYDTQGLATSGGSLALATHVPRRDGFIVRRLREAGAVILGKTNLHELASGITSVSSLGGQTLNPYDPARCPGGSSGGTGAAVAASFAAVGWGTDTCGSIRIPAAFAALFGLRPTQGTVSRAGIVPLALTQDVAGPLARTAMDLALALDVTIGADPDDPATAAMAGQPAPRFVEALRSDALRGARIGIFRPYFRDAEPDIADTVRAAALSLRALGAEVVEVEMRDFDEVIAGTSVIPLELRFQLADYLARASDAPVQSLTEILDRGLFDQSMEARFRARDTVATRESESRRKALARQSQLRSRILALMDSLNLDALAYPTSTRKPVLVGDPQLGTTCALSSQTGLPALTMPAGFTADGLPTGLELLGRPNADVRLVSFAYAFEQAGRRRRPPPTTPALVNGRAPGVEAFSVRVGPTGASAAGTFTFDPTTSELRYVVRLTGRSAATVQAVVMRRHDAASAGRTAPSRVLARVLGPGMTSGSGRVRLFGDDLASFLDGRLTLAVFGSAGATPVGESVVRPGR